MRRLFFALVLIIISGYTVKTFSQIKADSLQKEILKSIQQKYGKGEKMDSYFDSSKLFLNNLSGNLDKIFEQVNKEVSAAKSMGDVSKMKGGYYNLSALDSMRGNYKGAYENYKLYSLYRDSLQKKETEKREIQAKLQYEFDKKQAIAKAEQEKKDAEQRRVKNIQYFTIAGLAGLLLVIVIIAFIQWKNNNQKKKANILLQLQKEKVESTLSELKSTQTQLIHQEKMASLGELTAGIAHQIQNPLNFVNNFSEVNKEMIDEVTEEIDKGNITEVKNILNDIKDNEEKINHHGKRADSIVKGMLQHSRQTKGVKEPTDINALCDEYLRLSYHGLRAKDKGFNADFKTDFDLSIGKINIVSQDIGRVLLNLFNNAFYAVNEKLTANRSPLTDNYKPTVSIQTRKLNDKVEIIVSDNGNGIPQNIIDKIFQPFFTTKPTGEGTGLGLSLSYDIIKAHGGEIKVETKVNEGSIFIIYLPTPA
jgi:two-component system, NtrC family, sensor kinase